MKIVVLCTVGVSFVLSACATKSSPADRRAEDRRTVEDQLGQEISLKEDRSALKGVRKDISVDKQKENDELALFLNIMRQGKEQPSLVREKFATLVQKKRTDWRTRIDRLRQDYHDDEVNRRETFLNEQRRKREKFFSSKHEAKENSRFTADQERDRQRFFADERERRSSFDAELNGKSKEFDAYMRERQAEFNEQFRLYSKQISEQPKAKKAVTGDEFKRLEEAPASPLGTED